MNTKGAPGESDSDFAPACARCTRRRHQRQVARRVPGGGWRPRRGPVPYPAAVEHTLKGSGGPDATEQYPIANGHIAGDQVHFEITTGEWKFFYDLKLSGQALAGTLILKSATDTRSAQVKLTRGQ